MSLKALMEPMMSEGIMKKPMQGELIVCNSSAVRGDHVVSYHLAGDNVMITDLNGMSHAITAGTNAEKSEVITRVLHAMHAATHRPVTLNEKQLQEVIQGLAEISRSR